MAQLARPAAVDVAATEEESAAWTEALDVDDSDLRASLLSSSSLPRPSTAAAPHMDKPSPPSHGQRIPGPASAVQEATRLRAAGTSPVCGRANAQATDADFLLHPWLSALQFLGKDRVWEHPGIRAIKTDQKLHRAPLVVGVVTSCKPTGLGDLFLTLKDPSDTIGASVHRKILSEGNIGQDISVGCAIVLAKVGVFRPSHTACYLNVTNGKIVKVMRKDCASQFKQEISSRSTSLEMDRSKNAPSYSGSQQSPKTVDSKIPANWQQRQGESLPMFERGEAICFSNNIMMRLSGCGKTMPSCKEMTVSEVSDGHHRAIHSSNLTSAHITSRGTDGHPQKSYTPNRTCSHQSPDGHSVSLQDRSCTQASDNKELRLPFADELVLTSSKKSKTYHCYDALMNTTMDTKRKHGSDNNMDIDVHYMAEPFHSDHSTCKPDELQQKDFCANAGTVRPLKEKSATDATANSVSLLSQPKKTVSVASVAGWTDEQLSELFADY